MEEQRVNINLGSGTNVKEGFINIDIIKYPGVQIQADVRNLKDFEDNSVDFILGQHILEYIPREHLIHTILEWKRILKKGSALEFRISDLRALTKALYLNNISGELGLPFEMVNALIYGEQRSNWDIRYSSFTPEYLQGILYSCGIIVTEILPLDYDFVIRGVKS